MSLEMLDDLMQGAERDLVNIWQKMNAKRFDLHLLKPKTVGTKATPEGIELTFVPAEEGEAEATQELRPTTFARRGESSGCHVS